jgi:hypothetical protein
MSNEFKGDRTVILTGAGASKPLGYATTAEFFDKQISGAEWTPNQENVFKALVKVLGDGIKDVENILRVLEPAEEFLKTDAGQFLRQLLLIGGHSDSYTKPTSQLANQIRDRCFDVYGQAPSDSAVKDLYWPLFDLMQWRTRSLSAFTLNYDLVHDSILELARDDDVTAYDGFSGSRNRFDPTRYIDDRLKLKLYRLHGSMSWIDSGGTILNQRHCERTRRPHIYIPPGFKGEPDHSKHAEPIILAHDHFRKSLKEAFFCIVIGYSFRDQHINKCLDKAFEENGFLTVIVVDPVVPNSPESEFAKLLKKHGKRFVHIQQRFGDSLTLKALGEQISNRLTVG